MEKKDYRIVEEQAFDDRKVWKCQVREGDDWYYRSLPVSFISHLDARNKLMTYLSSGISEIKVVEELQA